MKHHCSYLLLIGAFVSIFVFTSCTYDDASAIQEYDEKVLLKSRTEKDDHFKNDNDSPIASDRRADFEGLNYFPPSEQLFIVANFIANPLPDTVSLPTSKASDSRKMIRFGLLEFQINDSKELKLTAYKELGDQNDMLFVPFRDKTSGFSTYEAGRYLEISEPDEQQLCVLDFNKAYNPFCAYSSNYACPLIPIENTLAISILAGEKNPSTK